MAVYTISEVAEMSDMTKETLRYYESIGLIGAPRRSEDGYREYNEGAVERLRFVKRAQETGFTLKEIAELLSLSEDSRTLSLPIREMVQRKLKEVDSKIEQFQKLRANLDTLLNQCNGTTSVADCPIIESLAADSK